MMRMWTLTLCAMALWPTPAMPQDRVAPRATPPRLNGPALCPRRSLAFAGLAAGLNRALLCSVRACANGGWTNTEVRELAGYAQSDWLWIGSTPAMFAVSQQNGFITTARSRALTMRPAGKTLISISFFTDIAVGSPGGGYFVGARANYGICQSGGPAS